MKTVKFNRSCRYIYRSSHGSYELDGPRGLYKPWNSVAHIISGTSAACLLLANWFYSSALHVVMFFSLNMFFLGWNYRCIRKKQIYRYKFRWTSFFFALPVLFVFNRVFISIHFYRISCQQQIAASMKPPISPLVVCCALKAMGTYLCRAGEAARSWDISFWVIFWEA